jgi:hypothetical protein
MATWPTTRSRAALERHMKMVAEQLNELQKDIRVAEPLALLNLSPGDHWIKFLETKAETLVVTPGEPTTMSMENVSTPDVIVAAPGSNVVPQRVSYLLLDSSPGTWTSSKSPSRAFRC